MDIQFVAESSLALAHYVSGYVTKAERSNMQEIWEEVSKSKSIYGRLWSLASEVYAFENVDCMKPAICCSVTTSMKNLTLSSG